MATGKNYVAYYRVSTSKQSLGIDAQKELVQRYVSSLDGAELIDSYTEIETGKGANALDRRPQLRAALDAAKKRKATLIVGKLDRLSRSTAFVSALLEGGVDFVAADMPAANKVMLQMFAVIAEYERDQIAARTRAALAVAKARGVTLGNPRNLMPYLAQREQAANEFAQRLAPVVAGFRAQNFSQVEMVEELNRLGVKAPRGGSWSRIQLQRVLGRIQTANAASVETIAA